jgi:uncharacterized protein (DUF58 family)
MFKIFKHTFPSPNLWYGFAIAIFLFILSYPWPWLFPLGQIILSLSLLWFVFSTVWLFYKSDLITATRNIPEILSLGDENTIKIHLKSKYPVRVYVEIIDEIPVQFQKRDFSIQTSLKANESKWIEYQLVPKTRGEYAFGNLHFFIRFNGSFATRRFEIKIPHKVKVYPSIIQMKLFQLKVLTRISRLEGAKKLRRIGQSYEFEQIKNYVEGDDFRHINWKATSRAVGALKINQFEDEKSQPVYNLIDKSRNMKMPFNDLSLLDYAINSSLVIANTALIKGDKAGLITFAEKIETGIKAENKPGQLGKILQSLYNERQGALEANYEHLYQYVNQHIKQRSLLFLYTNFETTHNLQRILPILQRLNRRHVLVLILFQNSEIIKMSKINPSSIEEIYNEVIAERFIFQKSLIAKELKAHGIKTILTLPEELTINTVNKYLEVKSLGLI